MPTLKVNEPNPDFIFNTKILNYPKGNADGYRKWNGSKSIQALIEL
jgi:hypothetical protein